MADLHQLHDAYLKNLVSENGDVTEYFLDCCEFIRNDDICGWKKKFSPVVPEPTVAEEPKPKRRRMAPSAVLHTDELSCKHCGSKSLLEDTKEGQTVCTNCGIVNETQMLVNDVNPWSEALQRASREYIHRYSRIVYFRSFLLSISGNTNPMLTPSQKQTLKDETEGIETVTAEGMMKILKKLKLQRLRRHQFSLAETYSKTTARFKPTPLTPVVFKDMLKLFRRVEQVWPSVRKSGAPDRKVFINYSYLFFQFCHHLGVTDCATDSFLLKCPKRAQLLHKLYGRICKKTGLTQKLHFRTKVHGKFTD